MNQHTPKYIQIVSLLFRCIQKHMYCTGWIALSLFLTGCLQPDNLTQKLQRITVEALHPNTAVLVLDMRYCENGKQVGSPLGSSNPMITRKVDLHFGGEQFYFPMKLNGFLDVRVTGYRALGREQITQHARVRMHVEGGKQILPTIQLKSGEPATDQAWCAPYVKPPPRKRPEKPVEYSPNLSMQSMVPTTMYGSLITSGTTSLRSPRRRPRTPHSSGLRHDFLEKRTPIQWEVPTVAVASAGRLAVIASQVNALSGSYLSVIDVLAYSNRPLKKIMLPERCQPRSLDVQGNICAVACHGLGRVFMYTLDGEVYGPQKGIDVGPKPIAVRISGNVVVTVREQVSKVQIFRLERWSEPQKTFDVGEFPSAITAVNGSFFVSNAMSNSVTSFRVDRDFRIHPSTPYSVGLFPTGIAANEWYIVVANQGSANVTILQRNLDSARTLYLGGRPHSVVLLGHTAIISNTADNRLHLLDLRKGRVVQVLKMDTPIAQLALTGEWLLMPSTTEGKLARASLSTRRNLIQLRVGERPTHLHVANGNAWTYDALAQTLSVVDLRSSQVKQRIPLSMDGWFSGTEHWLFHTDRGRSRFVVRSLSDVSKIAVSQTYDFPIQHGRVFYRTLPNGKKQASVYLLHWEEGGPSARLSVIDVLPASSTLQWDFSAYLPLGFARSIEPCDVFPWSQDLLILADKRMPALFFLKKKASTQHSEPVRFELLRTLVLPSRPLRMTRIHDQLALALDEGSIWFVDVQKTKKTASIVLASQRGQLGKIFKLGKMLAAVDMFQGLVSFIDPYHFSIIARIRVGASPASLRLWNNPSDPTWRELLVVANKGSETLSVTPLSFTTSSLTK